MVVKDRMAELQDLTANNTSDNTTSSSVDTPDVTIKSPKEKCGDLEHAEQALNAFNVSIQL